MYWFLLQQFQHEHLHFAVFFFFRGDLPVISGGPAACFGREPWVLSVGSERGNAFISGAELCCCLWWKVVVGNAAITGSMLVTGGAEINCCSLTTFLTTHCRTLFLDRVLLGVTSSLEVVLLSNSCMTLNAAWSSYKQWHCVSNCVLDSFCLEK